MFSVTMPSGATFELTVATTIVLLALILLGVELVKAARIGTGSIVDHVLATLLLLAFVVEFLLVPPGGDGNISDPGDDRAGRPCLRLRSVDPLRLTRHHCRRPMLEP